MHKLQRTRPRVVLVLLALFFLSGSVAVLAFPDHIDFLVSDTGAFLRTFLVPAGLLLSATSLLGVIASPMCLALMGFSLTKSVVIGGVWKAIICGVPSLLVLPCNLYLGVAAFSSASMMLRGDMRHTALEGTVQFLKYFLLFLPLYLTAAVIETELTLYLTDIMID